MANKMTFKMFTSARMQNMRQCDGKNYKFSADWSQPQPRNICAAAIKSVSEKLALIAKQPAWGTKEDTPALVAELAALLPTAQLGADDMQNSFIAYQTERYFLRIWWRGTSEEREKLVPKTEAPAKKATAKKTGVPAKKATAKKTETSAPAPAPAPAPKTAQTKKASTKKASTKKASTKIASALPTEVNPEWEEMAKKSLAAEAASIDSGLHVETNDQYVADVMNVLTDLLVNELSYEQKKKFVTALTSMLQQSF